MTESVQWQDFLESAKMLGLEYDGGDVEAFKEAFFNKVEEAAVASPNPEEPDLDPMVINVFNLLGNENKPLVGVPREETPETEAEAEAEAEKETSETEEVPKDEKGKKKKAGKVKKEKVKTAKAKEPKPPKEKKEKKKTGPKQRTEVGKDNFPNQMLLCEKLFADGEAEGVILQKLAQCYVDFKNRDIEYGLSRAKATVQAHKIRKKKAEGWVNPPKKEKVAKEKATTETTSSEENESEE